MKNRIINEKFTHAKFIEKSTLKFLKSLITDKIRVRIQDIIEID